MIVDIVPCKTECPALSLKAVSKLPEPKFLFGLFGLRLYVPVNNFSVMSGRSHRFLGITSTLLREVNISCSRIQHGNLSENRTPNLSLQSPTLYHQATAPPSEPQ